MKCHRLGLKLLTKGEARKMRKSSAVALGVALCLLALSEQSESKGLALSEQSESKGFVPSEPRESKGPVNAVKAGDLVIDPPTLINLGFEWIISGDDNRNAKVDVSYRKKGDTAWNPAMPLLRLQHERVFQREGVFNVEMPNMFAGS